MKHKRLWFFWMYWQNYSWLRFGHANDFFLPIQSNIVLLANGYINTALFILPRTYVSCNMFTSGIGALNGPWIPGCDCRAGGVWGQNRLVLGPSRRPVALLAPFSLPRCDLWVWLFPQGCSKLRAPCLRLWASEEMWCLWRWCLKAGLGVGKEGWLWGCNSVCV